MAKRAVKKQSATDTWLGKLRGATGAANASYAKDAAQRVKEGNKDQNVILTPEDLSGNYDAQRVLETTLGGQLRPITSDDLSAFAKNVETVAHTYKKGITAKAVIDLARTKPMTYTSLKWSGKSDIDKASEEIKHATPHSVHKGLMRFVTPSASDKSLRHYVSIRFEDWSTALMSPESVSKKDITPDWRKTALWLKNQPLAFDCDCGRHRFWFRYVATIGKFNAGRDEHGFPKIRNPNLHGVACKHTLRVMSDIQKGHLVIINLIAKALEKEHALLGTTKKAAPTQLSQKEAEKATKGTGRSVIGRTVSEASKLKAAAKKEEAETKNFNADLEAFALKYKLSTAQAASMLLKKMEEIKSGTRE
jgi:hypothetical protein